MSNNSKPNGYFDYISFPNREQRDNIRNFYFDTECLRINKEIFSPISTIIMGLRKSFIITRLQSKIISFNNTVVYLDLSLLQMKNYRDLINTTNDKNDLDFYEILFRQACRNVSCEIYVYEEKIKDILRLIVKQISEKKEIGNKGLLLEFKKICGNKPYCLDFYNAITAYHDNMNVVSIKNFRNDEVHNESNLLSNYSEKNTEFNNNLFQMISRCLNEMVNLKVAFQTFLSHYINEIIS